MNIEAQQLLTEALKRVPLRESFSPAEIGEKIGFDRPKAETAARCLSDAGILVLGFDCAAQFSLDFRKMRARGEKKRA